MAAATQRVRADQRTSESGGESARDPQGRGQVSGTMAAVGYHYRPGDEPGRLVGEKEHARGDLRRRATAPDRSGRRGGGFER